MIAYGGQCGINSQNSGWLLRRISGCGWQTRTVGNTNTTIVTTLQLGLSSVNLIHTHDALWRWSGFRQQPMLVLTVKVQVHCSLARGSVPVGLRVYQAAGATADATKGLYTIFDLEEMNRACWPDGHERLYTIAYA